MNFLAISVGAALGANARHWVGMWATTHWGDQYPFGTFIVNLLGCFLIGLVMGYLPPSKTWHLLVVTGFLGGFTTFSSFSYETLHLFKSQRPGSALSYLGLSAVGSLVFTWIGTQIALRVHR